MLKKKEEAVKSAKITAPVLPCQCAHQYQDSKYGQQKRVHTVHYKKGAAIPVAECTVCGKKHDIHSLK